MRLCGEQIKQAKQKTYQNKLLKLPPQKHNHMHYKKASFSDLDQLSTLFDGYRVFYRKESNVNAAEEFLKARLEQKDSVIFVAEENEQLLGFTQLYPLFSSTRMKKLWLLNDLYVASAHRGKGISKGLIDQAKALVKESGACGMFLETEISNEIGNALYPRTGFSLNEGSNFYDWNVECRTHLWIHASTILLAVLF